MSVLLGSACVARSHPSGPSWQCAAMQVEWHPACDLHFAVLASDNVFRLYHVDDLNCPVPPPPHHFACVRTPPAVPVRLDGVRPACACVRATGRIRHLCTQGDCSFQMGHGEGAASPSVLGWRVGRGNSCVRAGGKPAVAMAGGGPGTQEQHFELQLRERQPLGLLDADGSSAVAFAFGSLQAWRVPPEQQLCRRVQRHASKLHPCRIALLE